MTAPRLSQLPAAAQANVRRLAAAQGVEIGPPVARKAKRTVNPAHWQGDEASLQKAVNTMLRRRGYWPRDKKHILGEKSVQYGTPRRGWHVRVPRAIGNAILLDDLLLVTGRPHLEMEGKTAIGKLSEIQEAICTSDGCKVYRSVEEAEALVKQWEKKEGTR